jgi:beta-phosphoglucomutase
MIEAFLFDLDGVLVDTAVFHFKAWKRLANELGFDIDHAFNETLKGISRVDSLEAILRKGNITLSPSEKERLASEKNNWYLEYVHKMTENDLLPGIKAFITAAKTANIKIGLGSASKNAPLILEKTGIISLFDTIVDGNHVKKSKPDPEVFLLGAQNLKVRPQHCVVFEDAYAGLEAAKAANMKSIGIGKEKDLPNADFVFTNLENLYPAQILALFKSFS